MHMCMHMCMCMCMCNNMHMYMCMHMCMCQLCHTLLFQVKHVSLHGAGAFAYSRFNCPAPPVESRD